MYNNVWGRGEEELLNEKGYRRIVFFLTIFAVLLVLI